MSAKLEYYFEIGKQKLTWLSNCKTDALVSLENIRKNALNQFLLAELNKRWAADTKTTDQIPDKTSATSARNLIGEQHLVEEIPLLRRNALHAVFCEMCGIVNAHQTSKIPPPTHGFVDAVGNLLVLFPFRDVWHDVFFDPLSDFGAEIGVGLVKVGRVVLRI